MKALLFAATMSLSVAGLFARSVSTNATDARKLEQRPAAFLGIAMDTSHGDGVRVEYVEPGSPAARAGVERDAIIFGICGLPVRGVMAQVSEVISVKKPGDEIELRWHKDGKMNVSKITLGARTKAQQLAKAAIRGRLADETKAAMNRKVEEAKKHIGELTVALEETASEKRARLENEIRKADAEAAKLQRRAAQLREELRAMSK